MSFCKFSTEYIANSKTEIDNIFINDYLPFAEPRHTVVYLYGLYICNSNSFDNSIENFAKTLNMAEEEVLSSFEYWEEQGLVRLLKSNPLQVTYIPLKNVLTANKLYKPEKYEVFNQQAQDIFKSKRQISKHEYEEYYDFLERYHVEQEALLMIMKYCVDTKKSAVGYNYILTVARNWANEGITNTCQVEEKLQLMEEKSVELNEIFKVAGLKRSPYVEERVLFAKWLNEYGFNIEVILYLVKKNKTKSHFSFEKLDTILTKYYEMKLFSVNEIETFEAEKKSLYELAKQINKSIGVYYENLEGVVESYILKWINMGFSNELLLEIAEYCFKTSVRTLEGMNQAVNKFYKLGILSTQAFGEYMEEVLAVDHRIKNILSILEINRNVNYLDRENYKTWKEIWRLDDSLIEYSVTLSKGKDSPLKYLSRVLADWHEKGIKTVDEAKISTPVVTTKDHSTYKKNFTGRSYTSTELNALFQSIDEIEI